MSHPQVWDIHVWRGEEGVPSVEFANPNRRESGHDLPDAAFYPLVDGEKRIPSVSAR